MSAVLDTSDSQVNILKDQIAWRHARICQLVDEIDDLLGLIEAIQQAQENAEAIKDRRLKTN